MFSTKLATVFAALAAAATAVSAAPATYTPGKVDIVFRPHVTAPKAGDVWPAGSTQTITWDTADIPEDARNQTGLILLGYLEGDSINEHLDVEDPLAAGFPITAGSAQVTVPADAVERDDYIIVLFGDSGNTSPKFTITKSAASSVVSSLPVSSTLATPSLAVSLPFFAPSASAAVSA